MVGEDGEDGMPLRSGWKGVRSAMYRDTFRLSEARGAVASPMPCVVAGRRYRALCLVACASSSSSSSSFDRACVLACAERVSARQRQHAQSQARSRARSLTLEGSP
jgi:hypothetical protein